MSVTSSVRKGCRVFLTWGGLLGWLLLFLKTTPPAMAHTCPSDATVTGIDVAISATYPSGQPVGTNAVGPGDELLFQLTLVYSRFAPDEQVRAAVQNGRMLLKIGADRADATPPGGVPLVGGDGSEGCNGPNNFKSLRIPYSVTIVDALAGRIPIVGIYTNGDAHLGPNGSIGTVSASATYEVAVRGEATAPSTNCNVTCVIAPGTNRVCAGSLATFAVTATNGAAPYRIVWSGPNEVTSNNAIFTITNAQPHHAGIYSATVTDSNDCTTVCQARLIVDELPSCFVSPGATSICAGSSATFTANLPPESDPVTFAWSGPSEFFSTNQTITVSNAGIYIATVTDANGCSSTCSSTLAVNQAPIVGVSLSRDEVCAGTAVTLGMTVSSGIPPYRFLWMGPDAFYVSNQNVTIFNLQPVNSGVYTAAVVDAVGCISIQTTPLLTVNRNPTCAILPGTNQICLGDTASFTAVPSNGIAPYRFTWAGPSGFISTNQTITISNALEADAGLYTATVVDARGCLSSNHTARLVVHPQRTCAIAPGSFDYCAGASALFLALSTNYNGPRRFIWSGPGGFSATNEAIVITNVQPANAGMYTVTMFDVNGCASPPAFAHLSVIPGPVCAALPSTTNICLGSCAELAVNAANGTAPYTIVLFNGVTPVSTNVTTTNATFIVCPVTPGTNIYTAQIRDSSGCRTSCTATVVVTPNPVATIVPGRTNVCYGECVEIRVAGSNGAAPYRVVLQQGDGSTQETNVTSSTTLRVCPPLPGTNTYFAAITDANGCSGVEAFQIVTYAAPVCAIVPSSNSVCVGSAATLSVVPQGAGPFHFQWNGPNGLTSTNLVLSIPNAQLIHSGIYSALVTDGNGCTTECESRLIVNVNPICTIAPSTNDICLSGSASFTANPTLGVPPYQYSWSGPGGFVSTNQTVVISNAQSLQAGIYRCTVTDANGCSAMCEAVLLVDNPLCTMTPSVPAVCTGSCIDLTVRASGGSAPYSVVVTGPGGFVLTNVTTSNLVARVCPQVLGPNVYVAEVTDAKGCVTTCQALITANAPIAGPAIVCPQAVNTYSVVRSNATHIYEWRLLQNNSDARIVASTGPSVQIYSGTNGSYVVHLNVYAGEALVESCDHLSTIVDTVPPVITCGDTLIVNEDPRSGGFAVVSFPLPTAIDNCDTNPILRCVPSSGSTFAVGQTTVNCMAMDDLGNTANCSFNVKVVPFVIIVVTSAADSGPGTLRQALEDANATPGLNIIRFQLPGTPPQTIRPLTPMPAITEPVRIEASAVGSSVSPVVVLDGTLTRLPGLGAPGGQAVGAATDGFLLLARSNLVRGLIINNFDTGIRVAGEGGNRIEANWIGLDATGLAPAPNRGAGIVVLSADNAVHGNVVSGNGADGILVSGPTAQRNQITGNRIGIGADGTTPVGNGGSAVRMMNVTSGNTVGGVNRGFGNLIGFNASSGVVLEGSTGNGNRISGNSIGSNNGLGIDLGDDGLTQNDPLDADVGPNGLQNFPLVTAARSDTTESTVVEGTFAGAPSRPFELQFFLQPAGSVATFGEGQTFLGVKSVTTDGAGDGTFTAEFLVPASKGQSIVVTATDGDGNTSEFSPAFEVQTPPETVLQPSSTTVPNGGSINLCVDVIGIGPFTYQWRREGRNIPGETNECLTIRNFDMRVAGTYTVAVGNDAGATLSQPSLLLLADAPRLQGADMFADRLPITGSTGLVVGSNVGATSEFGEPEHFTRPADRSVWYMWTPPGTGIATVRTVGSTFDTLLAVYVGSSLGDLIEVGADDDRGGFLSSEVRFNARFGTNYHIVVDGFGGADGDVVLSWEFEPTPVLLPVILDHPRGLTVAPGAAALFTINAVSGCNDGHHDCRHYQEHHPNHSNDVIVLEYQWFFNGTAIPGATNTNYVVFSVGEEFVGEYTVQVSKFGRMVESRSASLQINVTGDEVQSAFATDKVVAALDAPILLGGLITPPPAPPPDSVGPPPAALLAASTVVRGYTGTQVFNTAGGGTEPNDLPICGVIGGASVWVTFVPQETGLLHLNTDGSSYNTVMGVFVRSALNPAILQLLDCDNNSGVDGRDSALNLPVVSGVTNFVMVDGVNGATGTLKLNYSLVTSSTLVSLGKTPQGHVQVRVVGHPGMRFRVESSPDFIEWTTLIITNSASGVFDFVDTVSLPQFNRAYRAVMLP